MSVRFAPSPTGRFHLGNLRTAWISHEFARELGVAWVVRFEDIDRPRVVAGAMDRQLKDLRVLGMVPDQVVIQSERHARHESLFRQAVSAGQAYPCSCSRKELDRELDAEIHSEASAPHGDLPVYSGRCREPLRRPPGKHPTLAWRFRNPENAEGKLDFVIARTMPDGEGFTPAYHWACAIDDFDGAHSLLVRASDLAQASRLQRGIHAWVCVQEGPRRPFPAVFHAALLTADDGGRLEKRTRGITLEEVLARGMGVEGILRAFRASFERSLLSGFEPGKIWGERSGSITLRDAGF